MARQKGTAEEEKSRRAKTEGEKGELLEKLAAFETERRDGVALLARTRSEVAAKEALLGAKDAEISALTSQVLEASNDSRQLEEAHAHDKEGVFEENKVLRSTIANLDAQLEAGRGAHDGLTQEAERLAAQLRAEQERAAGGSGEKQAALERLRGAEELVEALREQGRRAAALEEARSADEESSRGRLHSMEQALERATETAGRTRVVH